MSLPTVSIIIPVYNYQDYVLDAVYSCLIQKYDGKIEVIVVDDCSTDNSHAILSSKFHGKIKLLQTESNHGYSYAKNYGIRRSNGDVIVTLDADDMLTEDSIRIRAGYLARWRFVQMVHGKAYVIEGDGGYEYWKRRIYKLKPHKSGKSTIKIHAQTTMIWRKVHLDYGLYDETLRSRSDNEMWQRLNLYGEVPGEPKIVAHHIEEPPFAFYRRHDRSMIEFRKKNKLYNVDVTKKLREAIEMRRVHGITRNNTPWLKR
jgi:glycosyltransferase involved in cell wall biosynthesis